MQRLPSIFGRRISICILLVVILLFGEGRAFPEHTASAAGYEAPSAQTLYPAQGAPLAQPTVVPRAYLPLVGTSGTPAPASTPIYTYRIINTYPHDTGAFTEGLVWSNGVIYESTGLNGRSGVREVDLTTGTVLQSVSIPSQYFGEGITVFGNTLVELTWTSRVGFIRDASTLAQTGTFSYTTQGWGLTHDGSHLIMSDGTSTLYMLDPSTLRVIGSITVTDNGTPITKLNELEYINGEIFANVWLTDRIARISPQTGKVLAWVDLTGLRPQQNMSNPDAVLNGIAFDQAGDRLFVTGKLWPYLYQIQLAPK